MTDWWTEMTKTPTAAPAAGVSSTPAPQVPETAAAPKIDWWTETTGDPGPRQFPGPRQVSQDPAGAAGILDVGIASLASDPQAQIRYFAQKRGIPVERYGIANDQIVYVDDAGKLQAEVPEGGGITGLARRAAQGAGMTLPAAGGLAGGLLTLPVAGGAPGAFGGAAAGQALREGIAANVMGQDVSPLRIATEGAFELGGQVTGLLISKGVSRALASNAAKKVQAYVKQGGMTAVDALKKTADELGVTLTPAELTNLPALRGEQKALSGLAQSAETMQDFYQRRATQQIDPLMARYFENLSPVDSGEVAGELARGKAKDAMDAARMRRVGLGSPAYRDAFANSGPMDLQPIVDLIDTKMGTAGATTRGYLNAVRKELYELPAEGAEKGAEPVLRTSLESIQNAVKEELDNQIGAAVRANHRKAAAALEDVKSELLKTLDASSPQYKAAREQWGDLSRDVNAAEGGVLANVAKTGDLGTKDVARTIMKQGPRAIADARTRMLSQEGGEDAWNATLRSYLEDAFEKAGKEYASRPNTAKPLQGPKFFSAVFGDEASRARLRAAMSDGQWRGFKSIMDVLEATGRAIDLNSDTAFKQEAIKNLRQSAPGALSKIKYVSTDVLKDLGGAYQDFRFGKNVDRLAKAITSPDSLKALQDVYLLADTHPRKIIAVTQALGFAGRRGAEATATEPDVEPAILRQRQPGGR
jgi:hypothetical protein